MYNAKRFLLANRLVFSQECHFDITKCMNSIDYKSHLREIQGCKSLIPPTPQAVVFCAFILKVI